MAHENTTILAVIRLIIGARQVGDPISSLVSRGQ
jgi:hypothetical protein